MDSSIANVLSVGISYFVAADSRGQRVARLAGVHVGVWVRTVIRQSRHEVRFVPEADTPREALAERGRIAFWLAGRLKT
jgi:hypothetical protein